MKKRLLPGQDEQYGSHLGELNNTGSAAGRRQGDRGQVTVGKKGSGKDCTVGDKDECKRTD